jgi:hypothetical protein
MKDIKLTWYCVEAAEVRKVGITKMGVEDKTRLWSVMSVAKEETVTAYKKSDG